MSDSQYLEIINLAASTENTPELVSYWRKKYEDLYLKQLFKLSSKSESLILSQDSINKPATTFGELVLMSHLTPGGSVDEVKLQDTIEVSVRFLDSLLDKINFTPEAKQIVTQYRKIGLGLSDFKEYFESKGPAQLNDEIDYIGNLVSGFSYRASESLAEEKGVCGSWDKIKFNLRPKSFEYWYNVESGEIRNGLEMSEEWNYQNIKESGFEIVPRRNSHILLYPADLEWQMWSDRDDTAPKADISAQAQTPMETNPDKAVSVDQAPNTDPQSISTQTEEVKVNKTVVSLTEEPTTNDELDLTLDQDLDFTSTQTPAIEVQNSPVQEPHQTSLENENNEKAEPSFQIGELVEINDNDSKFHQNIYQVAENREIQDSFEYKLIGTENELEEMWWPQSKLLSVELFEILDKLNIPNQPSAQDLKSAKVVLNAFIFSDKSELLLVDDSQIPQAELIYDEIPEQALLIGLKDQFNIEGKILEEIGSSIEKSGQDSEFYLHLGYVVEAAKLPEQSRFLAKAEFTKLPNFARILLNKLNRRQLVLNNLEQKISVMQKQREMSLSERVSESVSRFQDQASLEKSNLNQTNPMSKYSLKLEQLVKTNAFGDITVSLRYDNTGPKLISLEGTQLTEELNHLLSTILNLINFTLQHNVDYKELAEILRFEPQDGLHLPFNDLLKVISASLSQAPESVDRINSDLIQNIGNEFGKALQKNQSENDTTQENKQNQ